MVVDDSGEVQGWALYGDPEGLSGIKHRRKYDQHPPVLPDADRVAHGRFLFSGTVELLEEYGFERIRQVGIHDWIVSKNVSPESA